MYIFNYCISIELACRIFHLPYNYVGGNGDCAAILIDDGLVINGDSIEVEWQGVGPSTEYDCRLDDNTFVPCKLQKHT